VKDVEQRVQSLYGVLASPIGEDDNREKTRRAELQRFVFRHAGIHQSTHPTLRRLDGVIKKLEPLAEQHALLKFLRNVDNAKMLTGFAQELADAITDYQVCLPSHSMIFNNGSLGRFRCNKECMRGQGTYTMRPGTFW